MRAEMTSGSRIELPRHLDGVPVEAPASGIAAAQFLDPTTNLFAGQKTFLRQQVGETFCPKLEIAQGIVKIFGEVFAGSAELVNPKVVPRTWPQRADARGQLLLPVGGLAGVGVDGPRFGSANVIGPSHCLIPCLAMQNTHFSTLGPVTAMAKQ